MKVAKFTLALITLSLMASMAMAQPPQNGGQRRGGRGGFGGGDPVAQFDRMKAAVDKLTLSDDEKSKVAAVTDEYKPKVKALKDKIDAIYTSDQLALLKKASDAMAPGSTVSQDDRRQIFQDLRDNLKVTDEQRTKLQPLQGEARTLITEVRKKLGDSLTDANKTAFQAATRGRGGNRRGRGGNGGGGNGGGGNGGNT